MHDLSESDANRVLSRLSVEDLGAEKISQPDGRWAIAVPREKIVPALAFLDANRVLNQRGANVPTTNKRSLVPGREEQRFQYERSVALSIEDSLSAIQGVLEARVHLNLPETDPLFGTRKEDAGSGSVLLVVDSRFTAQDGDISSLVAGAAGIPSTKINVLRSVALPQVATSTSTISSRSDTDIAIPGGSSLPHVSDTAGWTMNSHVQAAVLVSILGLGVFGMLARRRRAVAKFSLPEGVLSEES